MPLRYKSRSRFGLRRRRKLSVYPRKKTYAPRRRRYIPYGSRKRYGRYRRPMTSRRFQYRTKKKFY